MSRASRANRATFVFETTQRPCDSKQLLLMHRCIGSTAKCPYLEAANGALWSDRKGDPLGTWCAVEMKVMTFRCRFLFRGNLQRKTRILPGSQLPFFCNKATHELGCRLDHFTHRELQSIWDKTSLSFKMLTTEKSSTATTILSILIDSLPWLIQFHQCHAKTWHRYSNSCNHPTESYHPTRTHIERHIEVTSWKFHE